MTSHDKACLASRNLCDYLFAHLNQLDGVNRKEAQRMCSIGVNTRFAYVYHRRSGLRVYLYGKEEDGPRLNELAANSVSVMQRGAMGSDWAKLTPYYLEIDSEEEVKAAVPLLSYASSQIKTVGRKVESSYLFPSEGLARELSEGARITVQVSRIERDPAAREQCIRIFGTVCSVCGFDFSRVYGEIGLGFIHVHHLKPLAATKAQRKVVPRTDLQPVCPNCHEMLHRQSPPFTIEELKAKLALRLTRD